MTGTSSADQVAGASSLKKMAANFELRDYSFMTDQQLMEMCGRLSSCHSWMLALYEQLNTEKAKLVKHGDALREQIKLAEDQSADDASMQSHVCAFSSTLRKAANLERSPVQIEAPQLSSPEELLASLDGRGDVCLTWFYDENLLECLGDPSHPLQSLSFQVRQQTEGLNGRLRTRIHSVPCGELASKALSRSMASGGGEIGEQRFSPPGCIPGRLYSFSVRAIARYSGEDEDRESCFCEPVQAAPAGGSLVSSGRERALLDRCRPKSHQDSPAAPSTGASSPSRTSRGTLASVGAAGGPLPLRHGSEAASSSETLHHCTESKLEDDDWEKLEAARQQLEEEKARFAADMEARSKAMQAYCANSNAWVSLSGRQECGDDSSRKTSLTELQPDVPAKAEVTQEVACSTSVEENQHCAGISDQVPEKPCGPCSTVEVAAVSDVASDYSTELAPSRSPAASLLAPTEVIEAVDEVKADVRLAVYQEAVAAKVASVGSCERSTDASVRNSSSSGDTHAEANEEQVLCPEQLPLRPAQKINQQIQHVLYQKLQALSESQNQARAPEAQTKPHLLQQNPQQPVTAQPKVPAREVRLSGQQQATAASQVTRASSRSVSPHRIRLREWHVHQDVCLEPPDDRHLKDQCRSRAVRSQSPMPSHVRVERRTQQQQVGMQVSRSLSPHSTKRHHTQAVCNAQPTGPPQSQSLLRAPPGDSDTHQSSVQPTLRLSRVSTQPRIEAAHQLAVQRPLQSGQEGERQGIRRCASFPYASPLDASMPVATPIPQPIPAMRIGELPASGEVVFTIMNHPQAGASCPIASQQMQSNQINSSMFGAAVDTSGMPATPKRSPLWPHPGPAPQLAGTSPAHCLSMSSPNIQIPSPPIADKSVLPTVPTLPQTSGQPVAFHAGQMDAVGASIANVNLDHMQKLLRDFKSQQDACAGGNSGVSKLALAAMPNSKAITAAGHSSYRHMGLQQAAPMPSPMIIPGSSTPSNPRPLTVPSLPAVPSVPLPRSLSREPLRPVPPSRSFRQADGLMISGSGAPPHMPMHLGTGCPGAPATSASTNAPLPNQAPSCGTVGISMPNFISGIAQNVAAESELQVPPLPAFWSLSSIPQLPTPAAGPTLTTLPPQDGKDSPPPPRCAPAAFQSNGHRGPSQNWVPDSFDVPPPPRSAPAAWANVDASTQGLEAGLTQTAVRPSASNTVGTGNWKGCPFILKVQSADNHWETCMFSGSKGLEEQAATFLRQHNLKPAFQAGLVDKMRCLIASGVLEGSVDIVDLI